MRDGERIVFTTAPDNEAAVASLQSIRADGSDTPRLLRDLQITDFAITSIAPDDSDLLGILYDSSNRGDIVALPLGDGSPGSLATETDLRRLWPSPANEQHATFSPDGRWIAFSSDRTGSDEIYVLRNSEGAIPIPVSTAGGQQPRWHPAGSALFYHDGTAMMSVAFDSTVTDTSPLGDTRRLFETTLYEYPYVGASFFSYDVMPDGERFLILRPPDATEVPVELRVIVNAIEELNALAPLSALSP
jgi:dipeptidyl aminopeptidase/acylaminoacyl peptidase